jgi:lysophospholipase L1-like esterase
VEDITRPTIRSYVALGDSFTEGLADHGPDGAFRGWADLVAERLALARPDLRYANLAVRGKLMAQISADQLAPALAMRPDLVSLAGGLNDAMRPGCDIDAVCADLEAAAVRLVEGGARLVMFRPMDFTRRMPSSRRIADKVQRLAEVVDRMGAQYGAVTVDLTGARVFDDPRLWAPDRIHLTGQGHRRVAEGVLEALGLAADPGWRDPLPPGRPRRFAARKWSDAVWLVTFLAPWIRRRLTGRSSGDGMTAKRPLLEPPAVGAAAETE